MTLCSATCGAISSCGKNRHAVMHADVKSNAQLIGHLPEGLCLDPACLPACLPARLYQTKSPGLPALHGTYHHTSLLQTYEYVKPGNTMPRSQFRSALFTRHCRPAQEAPLGGVLDTQWLSNGPLAASAILLTKLGPHDSATQAASAWPCLALLGP